MTTNTTLIAPARPTLTMKPLQWCDEREPNEDVRYNHVVAESPLGRITVEWKGWKEYDSRCVYVGGEYIDSGSTLEEAKKIAERHLRNVVEALTTAEPAPGVPSDSASAVRDACGKIIKTLAAIVNSPQSDDKLDNEVLQRDPVMAKVMEIKSQVDAIYKAVPLPIHPYMQRQKAEALTTAAPAQAGWCKDCNPDNCCGCATPATPAQP